MELHTIDLGGVSGAGGAVLRLDQDGLIDMPWATAMQSAGQMDFARGIRTDSTVPLARDLNYVLGYVRDNFRPGKYASVVKMVSIPDWAERWEVSKLTHTGSVQLSSQVGRQDIVTGDFSRDTTTGRVFEIVNGYKYWVREMVRAAKTGINPQTERAMAQAQAAEDFMDALVATGLVGSQYGSGGNRDLGLGLTGLANDPNVIADGILLGSAKSNTDGAWQDAAGADYDAVLGDLHTIITVPYVRSKERHNIDTLLMPIDEYNALNRLRPVGYAANALTTFEQEWSKRLGRPGNIIVWDRLSNIGTVAGGPRIVGLASTDENVAAYVMGKVYGVDQVREVTRGFEANASLVTGGVRILDSSGIVYMDLNPGA